MSEISTPMASGTRPIHQQNQALWQAAQKLEASFLAEMLKFSGLGTSSESFGGGPGEEQFESFLYQAQADQMVKAGGIGLAEALFESLMDRAYETV
ncbi:MAG: rod-binding protein [Paracoccaceae bacterium]